MIFSLYLSLLPLFSEPGYYTGLVRDSHRWVDGTDCLNDLCQDVAQGTNLCGYFQPQDVAMFAHMNYV